MQKAVEPERSLGDPLPGNAPLSQRTFFLILLAYFGLHTIVRTLISGTIDLDESEQLILTQKFSWGYGSQPPLYTWIQMVFFQVFGVSVFALALLKNILLFSIYVLTYFNVRLITRNHLCGVLGAVSLLFVPQIVWESQRDLTHSILCTVFAAMTLLIFLRLRINSSVHYFALGACAALGILSKYNYAAFSVGLLCSALALKSFRPLLLNKRILLSLATCVLMLLPHLLWATNNPDLLSSTAYKFHRQQSTSYLLSAAGGLLHLLIACVSYVVSTLAIIALIFGKKLFSKKEPATRDFTSLVLLKYCFVLTGLVVAVLFFNVTSFKGRWFEPIFISLPLLVFHLGGPLVDGRIAKRFFVTGITVALSTLAVISGRIFLAETVHHTQLLNAPYRQLAKDLANTIPADALILAETKWVGGNLRLLFPNRNVIVPELARLYPATNRNCVAIWDATSREFPGARFKEFLSQTSGFTLGEKPILLEKEYQFHREKKFRLGVLELKN